MLLKYLYIHIYRIIHEIFLYLHETQGNKNYFLKHEANEVVLFKTRH